MADTFGDTKATMGGTVKLTKAQTAARACREQGCRALNCCWATGPELPPLLGAAGGIRILCDMVASAHLAGDDLSLLMVVRSSLRHVRSMTESGKGTGTGSMAFMKEELEAAVALYNTLAMDGGGAAFAKVVPASMGLWGRSLVYIAEGFFHDSERHYLEVVRMAEERLRSALESARKDGKGSMSSRALCRANEALGRALLLRARHGIYNGRMNDSEAQKLLEHASMFLDDATTVAVAVPPETRTLYYDKARVAALQGDIQMCEKLLAEADQLGALPPRSVYRLEPDFSTVRDSDWFRKLCADSSLEETKKCSGEGGIKSAGSGGGSSYDQIKSVLMVAGITCESTCPAARFPLYMAKPQGPIPEEVMRAAEAEFRREELEREGKQRLQDRLATFGLKEKCVVPGDGNCQFAAISDQLCGSFKLSGSLRRRAVAWLREHADFDSGSGAALRDFVPDGNMDAYCDEMAKPGVWGDHLTLIAISEHLGLKISVLSSVKGDNYLTEIVPKVPTRPNVVLLSHFSELHYGSLMIIADDSCTGDRCQDDCCPVVRTVM